MASFRGRLPYAPVGAYGCGVFLALGIASFAHSQGSDADAPSLPVFSSAEEHYTFLLEQADGGTRHTRTTLPDWSGIWLGGAGMSSMRHPVDAALTPDYQAGYDELLRQMEDDGQIDFDRLTDCEPTGYPRWIFGGANFREFTFTPDQAWLFQEYMNETRRVYTDGRPHDTPEGHTWLGDSIGFWDEDKLVIWTLAVEAADYSRGYPENSDQLQGVELWQLVEGEDRDSDRIVIQLTTYDPVGLTAPWEIAMTYDRVDIDYRIRYWECIGLSHAEQAEDGSTRVLLPGETAST